MSRPADTSNVTESNPKRRKINESEENDIKLKTDILKSSTSTDGILIHEASDTLNAETFENIKSAIIRNESIDLIKNMITSHFTNKLWLQKDDQGYNLLHIATQFENIQAMKYLLEIGIEVNSPNSENNTPLQIALYSQKKKSFLESIKLLLRHGANMYSFDEKDNTFAHLLPYYVPTEQYDNSVSLLITLGHKDIFHSKNNLNLTPLHMAVEEIDVSTATLKLISTSCGYDFNKPHSDGNSLFLYAARWGGTRKSLENLIEVGANWQLRNNMHETALHLAVEGNNFDAINYFMSLGADVNARDSLGRTPMHHIESHETESKKHYIALTKLLLEHGADIYATDNYGDTVANDLFLEASREDYEKWANFVVSIGHGTLFDRKTEETNVQSSVDEDDS